jgi:hypothetical protein
VPKAAARVRVQHADSKALGPFGRAGPGELWEDILAGAVSAIEDLFLCDLPALHKRSGRGPRLRMQPRR